MRKATLLTALLIFIVGVFPAAMQDDADIEVDLSPITIPNTQTVSLTSAINGRDYQLMVALPDSYDISDQTYPVLYLLDPAFAFLSVTEFVRFLGNGDDLPELIVVGIGYPDASSDDISRLREHDYFLAQDEFIEVISQEIFPLVDSIYRTENTDRAIVGFSYGGEFVFHALVNRPDLFNRYAAIDSNYSEFGALFTNSSRDDEFRERLTGLDVKLFFAVAGNEILSAAIQNRDYEGLEASGLSLGNITHAAALHHALPAAIMAIYAE